MSSTAKKSRTDLIGGVLYLRDGLIAEIRRTPTPTYGRTVHGYSKRGGAPTGLEVRLEGEKRFRRVYVWQFSNSGTAFIRLGGQSVVVREYELSAS